MSKGVGYRPKLSPPRGRQLERSYRPYLTCLIVSVCIAVLIFVVFGLTAYNIYNHRFGSTERTFHAGDQVSLWRAATDLTSVFCSAYVVDTENAADFYLLPHKAEVDPSRHDDFTMIVTIEPRERVYTYNHSVHYLPEGSVASLTACRGSPSDAERPHVDIPAEFLVIVGDVHFKEWRKSFNNRHVKHRVVIPKNATCHSSVSPPHLQLTVSNADNYFFVLITSEHPTPSRISLTGNISRTVYNITGATDVCNHTESSCEFSLAWGSKQDIVAQVLPDFDDRNEDKSFITDCQVRIAFWIPVFGVAPFCVMVMMSVWCWYLLVRKRDIRSHYRQPRSQVSRTSYGSMDAEESAPLVSGPSPPPAPHSASDEDDRCASIQD